VPTESPGLLIVNIGDPARPFIGSVLEGDFTSSIALAGGFAYIVERQGGVNHFTVLDIGNPAAPRRRGAVPTRAVRQLDTRFPMAVSGRIAYLVEFGFGLQAIDINNSDLPLLVDRIDTPSEALNVAATDQFIYVTDLVFGLQVIRGPGPTPVDTDGDGVIDFFDRFPNDPTEAQDTNGDGMGDNADLDDDNDGFTDEEELHANPPTDPKDPRIFPVRLPPLNTTTLIVDAASPLGPRERTGTPEAPYRSLTEGIRAIRALRANGVRVETVLVRSGLYSPLTTQEIFPLNLFGLSPLMLKGAGREITVIDAGFMSDVISLMSNSQIIIEGFTLIHGAHGLLINRTTALTLRQNRIAENIFAGIEMGINSRAGNTITENIIERNGLEGIHLFERSAATITNNTIRENSGGGIRVSIESTAEIISTRLWPFRN
jgi:parallel beta-helix repeat protein